ncbi:hypothetical protein L6R52_39385 [Myxococcota bacterium]|nr:hypothetical protein [Myxococcota bacterium]
MMTKRLRVLAMSSFALGAMLVSSAALAQAEDPYAPTTRAEDANEPLLTRLGIGFAVGGGINNFTAGVMSDVADVGGAWTARVSVGTRSPIAIEAAYIGTANGIGALGLDDNAVLLGNGVEGTLRLNLTRTALQPYVFGGAAWKRYNLVNEDFNTSSIVDSDNVVEVPLGAGIAYHFRGFLIDGRADFRPSFDEDIVTGTVSSNDGETSSDNNLNSWSGTIRVGFEF